MGGGFGCRPLFCSQPARSMQKAPIRQVVWYIEENPVRWGFVSTPQAHPFSSAPVDRRTPCLSTCRAEQAAGNKAPAPSREMRIGQRKGVCRYGSVVLAVNLRITRDSSAIGVHCRCASVQVNF